VRGAEFRAAVKAATSARAKEKFLAKRRRSVDASTPMRPGMIRAKVWMPPVPTSAPASPRASRDGGDQAAAGREA
jgi:hypothetical protein